MRYELFSLICQKCGARNSPQLNGCVKCGGPVRQLRRCPSCQTENPPNAFLCVSCYRVLKSRPQTKFIHFYVPWPVSLFVIFLAFGWFSFNVFKGWIDLVSAQIELRAQEDLAYSYQRKCLMERKAAVKRAKLIEGDYVER